jgi:uncharacterized protein YodC (DUF2158 family)
LEARGLLLGRMLKSCAITGVGDEQRAELIRQLLAFTHTDRFVAMKSGTADFNYGDRVLVKSGSDQMVTVDYQGKKDVRYVAKGTKGPSVEVDQVYLVSFALK